MRRTQVHLDAGLSDALDRLARRRGTSRAEVIRDAARRLVATDQPDKDPIWRLLDLTKGMDLPPSDGRGSRDHDRILADFQIKQMEEFRKRRR